MKIDVLCLGDSIHRYEVCENTTIGVNDINKFFPDTPVDYLVCVDLPACFTKERLHTIENSWCKKFFTPFDEWKNHDSYQKIRLAPGRSNMKMFDNKDLVSYSNNSAFVACVMAFKLGAKEIRLFGADFTSHPNFTGQSFKRAMDDFKSLHALLSERDVKLSVTKESMLSLFIPSF
jgi:hypothetical protein